MAEILHTVTQLSIVACSLAQMQWKRKIYDMPGRRVNARVHSWGEMMALRLLLGKSRTIHLSLCGMN